MENRFGDSTGLTFASWMAFAVPLCFVNLILSWMWLSYLGWKENKKYLLPGEDNIDPKQKEAQILKVMKQKYTNLGPLRCHELSVLICFIVVILLWFFRKPLFMFGKYCILYTVLKIDDFSITHILREINFGVSRNAKSAISTHFVDLNFYFL